jgi:mRNA interferase ChpB
MIRQGDIYLVSLDPTFGREQQGRRPVLIISSDTFNRITNAPVILPITSGGNFARNTGMTVTLMGAGTETSGVIRCDQPRSMDLIARGAKYLETAPASIVDEALARISEIFE